MPDVILSMRDIDKSFPGVHALDHCYFELRAGEVHALVGENGAGKSTLMKILAGVYTKDEGKIIFNGEEVNIRDTTEAQSLGINIVHQEINLMQNLTVAENIYIGREPMRLFVINKKEQERRTNLLLDALNLKDIRGNTKVHTLTVAKQQMVEIAKALSFKNTKILILDEPTAALSEAEIEELFNFIRELRNAGLGIVYISHRMDELKRICDRVTIMRDGQYIGTRSMQYITTEQIINMMVGRMIYEEPKTESAVSEEAPVVLEAKNLTSKRIRDVSFQLRKGEILGFSGLMGAGRTEIARLICGADAITSGEIVVKGKKVSFKEPSDAVREGIGYLSEDRKRFGLCLGLSLSDNMIMANLEKYSKLNVISDRKVRATAKKYIDMLKIKTPSHRTTVRTLSGGNQQKVVLAKWLERDCDVLIFDEPTVGIDVGAKNEIYKLMLDLVQNGKSIIMISSDISELLRLADRIIVMREGVKTGELSIKDATQEKIMALATHSTQWEADA